MKLFLRKEKTEIVLVVLPRGFSNRSTCLTFRRNGNLIVGTVTGHVLEVNTASCSSQALASLSDGFSPMLELGPHSHPVRTVCVSPVDDSLVASCADETTISVTSLDSKPTTV